MSLSRRNLLKVGGALAAVPLIGDLQANLWRRKVFSTGSPVLDASLPGGGLRMGSIVAVVGPRGSGKSAFLLRLARANGVMDAYPIGVGTSDMLSIAEREDGRYIGSLMLNAAEPATASERAAMERDAGARDAFLTRWLKRTREVTQESGGLFAISICDAAGESGNSVWPGIPDYLIAVSGETCRVLKCAQTAA